MGKALSSCLWWVYPRALGGVLYQLGFSFYRNRSRKKPSLPSLTGQLKPKSHLSCKWTLFSLPHLSLPWSARSCVELNMVLGECVIAHRHIRLVTGLHIAWWMWGPWCSLSHSKWNATSYARDGEVIQIWKELLTFPKKTLVTDLQGKKNRVSWVTLKGCLMGTLLFSWDPGFCHHFPT